MRPSPVTSRLSTLAGACRRGLVIAPGTALLLALTIGTGAIGAAQGEHSVLAPSPRVQGVSFYPIAMYEAWDDATHRDQVTALLRPGAVSFADLTRIEARYACLPRRLYRRLRRLIAATSSLPTAQQAIPAQPYEPPRDILAVQPPGGARITENTAGAPPLPVSMRRVVDELLKLRRHYYARSSRHALLGPIQQPRPPAPPAPKAIAIPLRRHLCPGW
jgi:hypothetical protein